MDKLQTYLKSLNNPICQHCKLKRTPEGHDGCVGSLQNVNNACCGHGVTNEAYVQFNHKDYKKEPNKIRLGGQKALDYINTHTTIKR